MLKELSDTSHLTPCPSCQTPNRATARFCRGCGTWLLSYCPFCRAEILLPSAFCDQCGRVLNQETGGQPYRQSFSTQAEPPAPMPARAPIPTQHTPRLQAFIPADWSAKLEAARREGAMEGQRRVVTILFCDIQGSTEAASHFDPEEWAGIIHGAFDCMIPPVYHYEGTVARLMGDGLLAFFGAPIAHEDDPQRAVLAGLEIQKNFVRYKEEVEVQWGTRIEVRVGINTGLVVVGAVGSDLQVEYSALGDAINLAARMEQTAQPGTVQISEETYRQVRDHFEFEDLGFIEVKGRTAPVHTYRPLRQKSQIHLRGIKGLDSPTVGRENEIGIIQAAFENLSQNGVGALIFLTGEAGIGKSRLIHELRIRHQESALRFQAVSPLSFEASQPYAFFGNFLRQLTGITEMDSVEEARAKLADLSTRLPVELRGGVTGAFAAVLNVSGIPGEQPANGESFKRQLFATTRELVRSQFQEAPGVIILDDLHWTDLASLEIFSYLFPLVDSTPVLFLCSARPERATPVWQVKTSLAEEYPHRYTELPLQPLSMENSNALVDHLLHVADLPQKLRELILDKSEGNPFFLEEIVRTLIESGILVRNEDEATAGDSHWRVSGEIGVINVPDSLQALLTARLDRLENETRQVLQMAAVIGNTFFYRVLEKTTEKLVDLSGSLSNLQRMNMVVETSRLPELEYAFRHSLLRETAYRSILRKHRKEFHRRVGEAMEALYAARLDEFAPVLAMHFDRAEEYGKAYGYYLRAGDGSYRLHAVKEAISHYGRALEIVRDKNLEMDGHPPESLPHLCLRLGRAFEMDGRYEEALTHYSDVEAYARNHGDRELELAAIAAHATIYAAPTGKFDRELADNLSQKALALAEDLGDHGTEAKIYWNLMNVSGFSGEPAKSYDFGARSLEIARRYNLREQLAYTLNDFARASLMNREITEAQDFIEEAQGLWLELGNKAMYTDSLASAALIYMMNGDYERAERVCQEALQISRQIGNLWGQSYSLYTLGYLYFNRSEFSKALDVMSQAIRLVEPSGFVMPLIDSNAYIGLIYGYLGEYERGKSYALAALRHSQERLPAMQVGARSILAILEYWQGDITAMDEWLGDSDLIPQINSFTGFERAIAEVYRLWAKGEMQQLVDLYADVLPLVRPMGDIVFLPEILQLTGQALHALNRIEEARDFLQRAISLAVRAPHRKIETLIALSELESSQGHLEPARTYLEEARENIEIILHNLDDPELQAAYLARPAIKAVYDRARQSEIGE